MLLRAFGGWWKMLVLGEGEGGRIGGRSSSPGPGLGFDFDFGSGGIPAEGGIGFLLPSAG